LCLLFLATTFQGDRLTGWVQQTIPRPDLAVRDLQFLDSLTGFMVSTKPAVDTAFIFKTTDGGNNWSTTYFDSLYLISMDFVDKNVGYCGGAKVGSGILKKTTDGGNNWFTVTSIPFTMFDDIEFVNKDTGWICFKSVVEGALWRTTNGGVSWQMQLDYNYAPSKIFFVNSSTGWVIGNSGDNLYKTTNCGVNWFLLPNLGNNLEDVFFTTIDTGYVTGGGGNGMMKTINGGNNWIAVNTPGITTGTKLFFINSKTGWAGSGIYKIFASRDGFNWGIQTSPRYSNYNVSFVDSLKGWAGSSGLVHTTDGGGPIVNANQIGTEVPEEYMLFQNYPNPFNSISKIKYQISKFANIKIVIFDVSGREISILVNQRQSPGTYENNFDAGKLSSGIYFYSLFADWKRIDTKKMVLIK